MNVSQLFEALKTGANISVQEKLLGGLSVALLSMVTVFVILVIISVVISLLQMEKKTQPAKKEATVAVTTEEAITEVNEAEEVDDLELIAVITAAIQAASKSDRPIVVRKITRNTNVRTNWELTE